MVNTEQPIRQRRSQRRLSNAPDANPLPTASAPDSQRKTRASAGPPKPRKSKSAAGVVENGAEEDDTFELRDDFLDETTLVHANGNKRPAMNLLEIDRLPASSKLQHEKGLNAAMDSMEEGSAKGTNGHGPDGEQRELLDSLNEDLPGIWNEDFGNFVLLLLLYCLQGVPLGLTFGSIPFLLKSRLSYHELAVFSFASYPYSLKLLWSPIVDAYFMKDIGRRKSWIIPIQICTAFLLIFLGTKVDSYLELEVVPVTKITAIFLLLVFFSATQDIAVDGWALTLLSKENINYASTAQTVGLTTGYFLSFTVFLALNSPEFCNKYLRSAPQEFGVVQLGSYLQFWGIAYIIATVFLGGKKEQTDDAVEDVKSVYKTMWRICSLPNMRTLIIVLLLSKVGFVTNEIVTGLKLLELGFSREDLALAVLCDFPLQIIFGYYAARWSTSERPLIPWLTAFYGRLACALLGMFVIYVFPSDGVVGTGYFTLVIASTVLTSFMSTIQFVSIGCFFTRISDPTVGGTYMTLLNTVSNLGGTWPKAFVLHLVDYFTRTSCVVPGEDDSAATCASDALRDACKAAGGTCDTLRDGYYVVNSVGLLVGLAVFLSFIRPKVQALEVLGPKAWRVPEEKTKQ